MSQQGNESRVCEFCNGAERREGKAIEVAKEIFPLYDQILETSTRVDSGFNLVARAYYASSEELLVLMDVLKATHNVKEVQFSEIGAIVNRRSIPRNHTKASEKLESQSWNTWAVNAKRLRERD